MASASNAGDALAAGVFVFTCIFHLLLRKGVAVKLYIVTALIAICLVASCAPQIVYVVVTATPPPSAATSSPAVTAVPMPPAPVVGATKARLAATLFATPTASLPTHTNTASPTRIPTRYSSPTPTVTRASRDLSVLGLSADEERTVTDAVDLLGFCAPPLNDYVRSHIDTVTRGNKFSDANAYVDAGRPIVYLPDASSLLDPRQYSDALRTFVAAVALVHEARHLELGKASTEPDAYGFTLPLFDNPRCVPNDIGTFTIPQNTGQIDPFDWNYIGGTNEQMPRSYCPFFILHSYTRWRANLPYRLEPPAGVHPPDKPRTCVRNWGE